MQYWLMKTEPSEFSIDDLRQEKRSHWDGIRNYQARNYMMNSMQIGDQVLIYHSSIKIPAIVGLAKIASSAYPDHTAFDKNSGHFDAKSTPDNPRWYMVDVEYVQSFSKSLELPLLREIDQLKDMVLLKKGSRLSIQPVTKDEFNTILNLATAN